MNRTGARTWIARLTALAATCAFCFSAPSAQASANYAGPIRSSMPKLQHIIIIVQENRSFDSYFGTYPGANGIPMKRGKPVICNPDPFNHTCVFSYHETNIESDGGPHDTPDFKRDVDGGKMDGFVRSAVPDGSRSGEVMGYHTAAELPVYWTYANQYVLQDELFAPSTTWSLGEHAFLVSNWAAVCSTDNDPSSCVSSFPENIPDAGGYAWTDITWLLYNAGVSWKYYVTSGQSPDVINPGEDDGVHGIHIRSGSSSPTLWNPLPYFSDVIADGQLGNVVDTHQFYIDAATGALPAVSWVVPNDRDSEHPPESVRDGQIYVAGLVNAVEQGPDWQSSAIFITWDEWGGLFDHVLPPSVDWAGYGLRVPGLMISPWAKHGFIDHQALSFDAYDKLIEDLYLGGQRLDPSTDGRPDPRPDVREDYPGLGDLRNEFDFNQIPRPAVYRF